MENECEALPGVAYPGVRDNRSTLNTKTGYDDEWWLPPKSPQNPILGDFSDLLQREFSVSRTLMELQSWNFTFIYMHRQVLECVKIFPLGGVWGVQRSLVYLGPP